MTPRKGSPAWWQGNGFEWAIGLANEAARIHRRKFRVRAVRENDGRWRYRPFWKEGPT